MLFKTDCCPLKDTQGAVWDSVSGCKAIHVLPLKVLTLYANHD